MKINFLMVFCLLGMGYLAFVYSGQSESGYFPYLLLLLCPLMHFLVHRDDGGNKQ